MNPEELFLITCPSILGKGRLCFTIYKKDIRELQKENHKKLYIVSSFAEIKKTDSRFVFTDGHAYHFMSQFFNTEEQLGEIDWKAVSLVRWNDTGDDTDRKRRKQAEFLVYNELQLSAIIAFVVYNNDVKTKILTKFTEHSFEGNIFVKPDWYY